jgi:membrane-associated protease RseP (regulator of RpoE activity)
MNPFEPTPPAEIPRTYGAKPAWQRFLVVLAGPITHFVMAFLVLGIYFALVGTPKYTPVVGSVEPTLTDVAGHEAPSPAWVVGLRSGDVIVGVGMVKHPDEDAFIAYTRAHVGRPIELTVDRKGRTFHVTVTPVLSPVPDDGPHGRIGVNLGAGPVLSRDRSNPIVALGRSGRTIGDLTVQLGKSLGALFGPERIGRIFHLLGGAPRQITDPSGLVGGARIAGQAAHAGAWDALFLLFAEFNIFIGLINLVPLPPLDGGHLAVVALEKVTRRKVDPRKLIPVAALVAGFLVLLTVSLLYLDIVNPVPNPFR